jgi:hypothetical protein
MVPATIGATRSQMIRGFSKPNLWLIAGAALATIVALAVAVLFAVQTAKINRARTLLATLEAVPLENLSRKEVETLAKKYGSGTRSCSQLGCEYLFDFDNAPLHRLGLARLTRLSIFIGADAERARYFQASYETSVPASEIPGMIVLEGDFPVSVHVTQTQCAPPCDPDRRYYVVAWRTPARVPMKTVTHLPPTSSLQQRREALAFDLRCLRMIGGCRNALEMLRPEGWPALDRAIQPGSSPQ